MIKSVEIKNFQSHKKSKIEFSPGVNVITGTSDSGKTAILRALRWATSNKPSGDAFRSTWGGDTEVIVETDTAIISRSKATGKNLYILQQPNINGGGHVVFEAFGANVPEEIEKAFNLSSVNIQQQLDSPFLLSETAGAVAAHFNKIANLEIIDLATQRIEKKIRETKSTITYKTASKEQAEKQLPAFAYLEKFELKLEVMEQIPSQINNIGRNIQICSALIHSIQDKEAEMTTMSQLFHLEPLVNKMVLLLDKKNEHLRKRVALQGAIDRISEVQQEIDGITAVLSHEDRVSKLITLSKDKKAIEPLISALEHILSQLQANESKEKRLKQRLQRKEELFKEEMPDVCPLCGTDLKTKKS